MFGHYIFDVCHLMIFFLCKTVDINYLRALSVQSKQRQKLPSSQEWWHRPVTPVWGGGGQETENIGTRLPMYQ